MLKTLDVLIGATTVLLIFSMAVTVITQMVSGLLGRRGKHLMSGLADLIQQLGIPERQVSETVAKAVLTHPLIADGKGNLGTVIHREEFTKLLMDLASGNGVATLEIDAKAKLLEMLKQSGISDPDQTLKNVRAMALQLEASNPELANDVRQAQALMHEAASDYVARVNSWFDQTIDRVSQRFTQYTNWITIAAALVVVLTVQVDIIAVVDRLSIDDQFRNTVVTSAAKDFSDATSPNPQPRSTNGVSTAPAPSVHSANPAAPVASGANDQTSATRTDQSSVQARTQAPNLPATQTGSPNATSPPAKDTNAAPAGSDSSSTPTTTGNSGASAGATQAPAETSAQTGNNQAIDDKTGTPVPNVAPGPYYDLLSKAGLITLPTNSNWFRQLKDPRKYPGMVLAILLISLGAPFWYNILKDLLGLRSQLAQKDAAQRTIRQTTQDATGAAVSNTDGTPAAPAWLKGERGDLNSVG